MAGALAGLALAAAGCAGSPAVVEPFANPAAATGAAQIVLRFDNDDRVVATLADSPAAREFAARLPLTLDLSDAMGQAKVAPLISPLPSTGTPVSDPAAGGLYWAPADAMIALYYDDLGQSVPTPALIPLGHTASLESVEHGRGPVRVELAVPTRP